MKARYAGILLLSFCLNSAWAQTRAEIPIRAVVLSDGTRRYGLPITVGGTQIEAGLDSGSTGLRVLPGVLAASDAQKGSRSNRYGYGAGTQFEGKVGTAVLHIGGVSGTTNLQLIDTISCMAIKSDCPAAHVSAQQFGVQGNGLPGEGFKAIIGTNMAPADDDGVASTLLGMGIRRWIIELPRPGDTAPGKLILNPSDEETKDFRILHRLRTYEDQPGGLHDAVKGCLVNTTSLEKGCGALLMDTGAPGIQVIGAMHGKPWEDNTPAVIGFYDGDTLAAAESLRIGVREQASHLAYAPLQGRRGPTIYAGLSPYFAFDVLYDPSNSTIGLKPRPGTPGAPTGALIPAKN